MAEIKNNFLKSRMNRDLDDRILPNGEYRDAQNIAISKSESADVGALENVLGNSLASSLGLSSSCGFTVIGNFADNVNNRIILFITDYTDSSNSRLSNFATSNTTHKILSYYPDGNTVNILAEGYFLNFSKTHYITGINVLENLLFWTDNRNQPRNLNILTAETNPNWYTIEENISVCKYYPWKPIRLYKDSGIPISVALSAGGAGYTPSTAAMPTSGSVEGAGLLVNNGAVGAGGALLDNLTINTPGTGYTNGEIVNVVGGGGSGGKIVVTTRMDSSMQDVCSEFLPNPLVTSAIITNGGTGYTPGPVTLSAIPAGGGEGLTVTITASALGVLIGVVTINNPGVGYLNNEVVTLSGGTTAAKIRVTVTSTSNPLHDTDWPGDCEYLKDKFVRFSYRFKFADGQYSLMAPFTQIAYIPKQDGYFISHDENRTYQSTEVGFMENKVNNISLMIDAPEGFPWAGLRSTLDIVSMDILYKESSELPIKIVDTIKAAEFGDNVNKGTTVLEYIYQSSKPITTLPEAEIIRASDKVPIKALAQEVTGNRVVYGNFLDKHSSPNSLDYNVAIGEKYPESSTPPSYVRKEYQNHTIKQNRSYQVGIVLCDKYGRQSDVILSSASSSISASAKGDTIYHPYKSASFSDSNLINNTDTWAGDSIKLTFNTLIPSTVLNNPGYPGLYSATNPLGWYSYKVVVKQSQQGYYNVYFPGILNGYTTVYGTPPPRATESDPTGFMVLTGDNINKVPKDLQDVGPNQVQFGSGRPTYDQDPSYYEFDSVTLPNGEILTNNQLGGITLTDGENPFAGVEGSNEAIQTLLNRRDNNKANRVENSSVILFGRVTNTGTSTNKRINPGNKVDVVEAISTLQDMGLANITVTPFTVDPELYSYKSNPYIGRLNLSDTSLDTIGVDQPSYGNALSVYETEPFTSHIDIYWETSTSGLISELNTAIATTDSTIPTSIDEPVIKSFPESTAWSPAANISGTFYARNNGIILAGASMILSSVLDGNNQNVKSRFNLVSAGGGGGYYLTLSGPMYAQADTNANQFTVYIQVTSGVHVEYFSFNTSITNLSPVFMPPYPSTVPPYNPGSPNGGLLFTFNANNGAWDPGVKYKELTWAMRVIYAGDTKGNAYCTTFVGPYGPNAWPACPGYDGYFYGSSTTEGIFNMYNVAGTPVGEYIVLLEVFDGGGLVDYEAPRFVIK